MAVSGLNLLFCDCLVEIPEYLVEDYSLYSIEGSLLYSPGARLERKANQSSSCSLSMTP